MNAIELLKSDHDQVEKLFDELDVAEDFYNKQEIFQKIRRELELHAYIEETHFYPSLEIKEGFDDLLDRSLDDHQEVRELLEEIEGVEDEDEFEDLIGELIDSVQSHIELEEEEVFPRVENTFTADEIEQLGTSLDEAKRSSEAAA